MLPHRLHMHTSPFRVSGPSSLLYDFILSNFLKRYGIQHKPPDTCTPDTRCSTGVPNVLSSDFLQKKRKRDPPYQALLLRSWRTLLARHRAVCDLGSHRPRSKEKLRNKSFGAGGGPLSDVMNIEAKLKSARPSPASFCLRSRKNRRRSLAAAAMAARSGSGSGDNLVPPRVLGLGSAGVDFLASVDR